MNPWTETQRAQLGSTMRAVWAGKTPEARQRHGDAISAGHRQGRKRHPVLLNAECFERLRYLARKRGLTSNELAVRLIDACVVDDIVDAVLDEEPLA